jgi:hypothetical protein
MAEVSFESKAGQTMNLNDEETALLDEISIQSAEKKVPLRAKPPRSSPFAKRVPGPSYQPENDGLDMFMNPGKRTAPAPPAPEEYDGGEEYDEEEPQQHEGSGSQVPSDGYSTIEDEKADLLNKISRLSKRGVSTSARLTIYSDIEEIRTEYKRMTYGIEVDRSIKFQRRMLVACVTGLEFLNDKFDPFDLELNGWSQNMMENVDDYDGIFEELYNKYKTKVNVAPEIKLMLMVGGSAMMFHLTNSMFKAAVPNVSQVMRQNPDLVRNMTEAVQRSNPPADGGRRDMRGPGMDFGSLMSMMGPPPPVMTRPGNHGGDDESVSDIVSIDAGGDPDTRDVKVTDGKKGKGRSKKKEVSI